MARAKVLKTITLGPESGPIVSLCPGHVTSAEFNKAWRAEGWKGGRVYASELSYEFWIPLKRGWKRDETESHKRAVPVTVMHW